MLRRYFVNTLLGSGMVATAVSIFYPILKFVIPPDSAESAVMSVSAGRSDDVQPNSGTIFKFGGEPGLLIRTPEGELRAFSARCTHLNCTVQYRGDLKTIWCACHNGLYDLTGRNVGGPPPRPLESYKVDAIRGEVVVSKA